MNPLVFRLLRLVEETIGPLTTDQKNELKEKIQSVLSAKKKKNGDTTTK